MIKIPFKPESFASQMKPLISGNNLTLDYYNLESTLARVTTEIQKLLGESLIINLSEKYLNNTANAKESTAVNYLQRGLLHFCMYQHLIFLITRVGNDGVTVKKNEDETTIFKYQQDDLKNSYITTAWYWINLLIEFLNANIADFPDWDGSHQQQLLSELPINLTDFEKWVGLTDGIYFILSAAWLIREVWNDSVLSRFKEPIKTDAIARAVCYNVMGLACQRLAYSVLPEPIRRDIDNEMGKNHKAQADSFIRDKLAIAFIKKADQYWNAVDLEIKQKDIDQMQATAGSPPIIGSSNVNVNDKFGGIF